MNGEPPTRMNVERTLRIVRRRAPIVLICILIAAGSAYGFAKNQQQKYTATASLLFGTNQVAAAATGLLPVSQSMSTSQQDTNVQLVGLGDVAAKTAVALGPRWSPGEVHGAVSAAPNSDTSLVTVSATASTPRLAQKIANTYSNVFVSEQQAQALQQISAAQRLVTEQYNALSPAQRAGAQGLALADRAQALGVLGKLQNGNVSFANQAALPTSPSSPKIKRDIALGGLLGLLIGLALASLLERLDVRIRDPKELEAIYEVPVLTAVPERSDYEVLTSLRHASQSGVPSLHDEVFNLLRSYLRYFAVARELRTLLVISAGPREGKTTISYNLAKAAAVLGSRVLLIEGDLRRRTVIAPLLDDAYPALPDVLIGEAIVQEAVRPIQVGPKAVLDVLIAGSIPPPNASELIESPAMGSVLDAAISEFDLVVIDTPPLSLVADAIPLLTMVDGVIIVGRVGSSRRDAAEQLHKRLKSLGAPVLGIVANGVVSRETSSFRRRDGYSYGYDGAGQADLALRRSNGSGAMETDSPTDATEARTPRSPSP